MSLMHIHMYMSLRKMYMSLNSFLVNDLHMAITYVKVVMISCSALVKLQFVWENSMKFNVYFLFMTKDRAINMLINVDNVSKYKYLWGFCV